MADPSYVRKKIEDLESDRDNAQRQRDYYLSYVRSYEDQISKDEDQLQSLRREVEEMDAELTRAKNDLGI